MNKPTCSTEKVTDETTCPNCGDNDCKIVMIKLDEVNYKCQKCGYEWQIIQAFFTFEITEQLLNEITELEAKIGLTIKTTKGKKYLYKQETINGKQRKKCLGNVESQEVKQLLRKLNNDQLQRAIDKWNRLLKEMLY